MSYLFDRLIKVIEESTFCYATSGGEGFTKKDNCQCYCNGEKSCQAYLDRQKFHSYFKDIEYDENFLKNRSRIINEIRDEFKDSQWYKDNVKE